jgi:hypothetical protein
LSTVITALSDMLITNKSLALALISSSQAPANKK